MKSYITVLAAVLLVSGFGLSCFAASPSADLTGDRVVDFRDFAIMASQWLTADPCEVDGGYDNSPVLASLGGQGGMLATGGGLYVSGTSRLFFDTNTLMVGSLSTVRLRVYKNTGMTGTMKLYQLRLSGSTYTVINIMDISSNYLALRNSADVQTLEVAISPTWAVQSGDIMAVLKNGSGLSNALRYSTAAGLGSNIVFVYGGDIPTTVGGTFTSSKIVDSPAQADALILQACYQSTTSCLPVNTSSPILSTTPIQIPHYDTAGYYVIAKGVTVPTSGAQVIDIDITGSGETNGISKLLFRVRMNFNTGTTAMQLIASDSTTISNTKDISGQQGHKFDIHIWLDGTKGYADVVFCDYWRGQGGQSDYDIRHINLTGRSKINLGPFFAKSVTLNQSAGSGGSIASLVVCRKPVVLVGDSFTSAYNPATGTVLAGVGSYIGSAFTQPRYVINCGIAGNQVLGNNEYSTAMITRWNSSSGDICSYRDCVVLFNNGPGLNDLRDASKPSNAWMITNLPPALMGAIATMASQAASPKDFNLLDTLGGGNDVIMTGLIPVDPNYAYRTLILQYNSSLAELAYRLQVPFFDPFDSFPSDEMNTDGVHPNSAGSQWLAAKIAQTYEQNKVP